MSSSQPKITPLTHLDQDLANFSIAVNKRREFYITGGCGRNVNEASNRAFMLDIKTLEWKELPDLNQARHGHASLILDGKLYVMGG